jgi:hypothetical protein
VDVGGRGAALGGKVLSPDGGAGDDPLSTLSPRKTLEANVTAGVVSSGPNLSPSDNAMFEALKAQLRDVTGQGIDEK